MQSKGSGEKRKQPNLHHSVVQNSSLSLTSGSISVLELPSHSAVTGCDSNTASQHTTGLHDDSRSNPCKGSIDEGRRATASELVRVGVNECVTSQHTDVGNLDMVKEKEAVVHGVVAELGTNISDVDVVEWLVCLQITDLYAEWTRPV